MERTGTFIFTSELNFRVPFLHKLLAMIFPGKQGREANDDGLTFKNGC